MAKKVLVVEDHPELRKMVADALRRLGYELLEAADGQTGISLASAERPDIVLLNLSLPGPSGVEVAKQLKGDSKTSISRSLPAQAGTTKRSSKSLSRRGS